MLLYLHGWVLRAAPLSYDDPSKQFLLVLLPPPPPPPPPANASAARAAAGRARARSTFLTDRRDGALLARRRRARRPLDDPRLRGGAWRTAAARTSSWRLPRLADHDCPHWAPALHRRRASPRWAWVAAVAFGQCDGVCESRALVRLPRAARRTAASAARCASAPSRAPPSLPSRQGARTAAEIFGGVRPADLRRLATPADRRAAAAPARGTRWMQTAMLHRTYAPWRMVACLAGAEVRVHLARGRARPRGARTARCRAAPPNRGGVPVVRAPQPDDADAQGTRPSPGRAAWRPATSRCCSSERGATPALQQYVSRRVGRAGSATAVSSVRRRQRSTVTGELLV